MKKYIIVGLLTTCISLSGCATTINLTPQERSKIKKVVISSKVTKPKSMYMMEPGTSVGMMFGLIGGMIAGAANESAATRFETYLTKNNIHIKNIARNEFVSAFRKYHPFRLVQTHGDATVYLRIKQYGLSVPTGFSSYLKPTLVLQAYMVKNKKVIWQNEAKVLPLTGGMPEYMFQPLMKDPNKVRSMWRAAAKKISDELVKSLS